MPLTHQVMTMPFRRFNNMSLRPIHRLKHVVDKQAGIAAGVTDITALVDTVDAPVLANTSEVETGAKVNGIYLKVEAVRTTATSGVLSNVYLMVSKNPGNNLVMPPPNTVGSSDNKRYIIHQEMVMLQQQGNGNPRTVFNGVIAIPRGYRRFGPDDALLLAVLSPGVSINYCIQCHFKEFR